jgi:LysR family transcriptional regulator, benzoate and cis,cis-muconate-responsive activator of ben and cat genes
LAGNFLRIRTETQLIVIRATSVGAAFLLEARDLLPHADQVMQQAQVTGPGVCLRVGYASSLASGMLAAAVEAFTQAHPGAQVELHDLSTAEMLVGLEAKALDVIIAARKEGDLANLKWTPLVKTSWKLAVGRKHHLVRRQRVTPVEVAREPLLSFSQHDYPEYWELITNWMREHRQRPRISGEYESGETLMAAVESGLGIAIVTTRTAHLFPSRVLFKDLSASPKPLCIAAAIHVARADDKALALFIEDLRKAFQKSA